MLFLGKNYSILNFSVIGTTNNFNVNIILNEIKYFHLFLMQYVSIAFYLFLIAWSFIL